MTYEELLAYSPYEVNKAEKDKLLTDELLALTEYHRVHCAEYADMLRTIGYLAEQVKHYEDLPFLPVRLFKEMA